MLARAERPTNDFHALARYLVHGKERPTHQDRVAWTFAQNLPTTDPENAATYMTASAALSKRCKAACYHLMVAWHERERPTPEIMQEIAVKTLHMAGLSEHQALIMGHGDKPHPHLHMMINRVHPDTGRAWDTKNDYARLDRIMRHLSEDYGFAYVPAHAFNPELTDDLPKKPNSRATRAARRGAHTTRPQWSRRQARMFSSRLSERLDQASSWEDLEMLLADEGLALEAKGKGHVAGDALSYVKLSALGLSRTAKGFERRRPPARRQPARKPASPPLIDAVDIAKGLAALGLADRNTVRKALLEVQGRRLLRLARLSLIDQLLADLRKTLAAWTAHTPPKPRKRQHPRPSPPRKRQPRLHRDR